MDQRSNDHATLAGSKDDVTLKEEEEKNEGDHKSATSPDGDLNPLFMMIMSLQMIKRVHLVPTTLWYAQSKCKKKLALQLNPPQKLKN